MARKQQMADARAACHDRAWREASRATYPGGPILDPAEAEAFHGDTRPMREYDVRRAGYLAQYEAWATANGESTGSFWRDLFGGFFG